MNKQFVGLVDTWLAATKKRDLETVLNLMNLLTTVLN